MALFPEFRRFAQNVLERRPFRRMLATITGCVRKRDDNAVAAEPVAVLENIGQRIPVVTEVFG